MKAINAQIETIFRQVVDSPLFAKYHPTHYGYRSLAVDVSFCESGPKFEWRAYVGGDFASVCIYGDTVEELLNKIEGYDPEESKRREIASLKAKLAQLEHPASQEDSK